MVHIKNGVHIKMVYIKMVHITTVHITMVHITMEQITSDTHDNSLTSCWMLDQTN